MNSLDTALHALAATSWRIGLLIVLCLVLRRVLRGRLPAAAVFAMWLVLAGALLVPVGVPARWSPFGLIPRLGTAVTPPAPVSQVQGPEFGVAPLGALPMPEIPAFALVPVEMPEPGLMDRLKAIPVSRWATVLWLAGVAGLVLRRAAALMIFSRRLRRDLAPADQRTVSAVERCRGLLGIRGEVTAGETSLVETPALHGIRRPRLLMPRGMADRLSDAELELVVLHELGHVRRRDLLAQTLIHGAAVLHWFNPLAWVAAHAARADCEHACDEFVLGRVEEERRHDYGAVLLKVVGLTSGPGRLPVVLGIFESKKQLQRRIHLIAGYSGRGRTGLLAGVALVSLVAAVALTREAVAQVQPAAATQVVAQGEPTAEDRAEKLARATEILRQRVNSSGVIETVIRPVGENRIEIQLPGDPAQSSDVTPAIQPAAKKPMLLVTVLDASAESFLIDGVRLNQDEALARIGIFVRQNAVGLVELTGVDNVEFGLGSDLRQRLAIGRTGVRFKAPVLRVSPEGPPGERSNHVILWANKMTVFWGEAEQLTGGAGVPTGSVPRVISEIGPNGARFVRP